MSGVALSENTVLQKTRVDHLKHVKNLNLWGNDLQDVSLLHEMPNVEVLSLSVNKISSLKDFAACLKLQELYLRKNEVEDLNEVRYLKKLRSLKILWLCDNPCADTPSYRLFVIWHLPQLEKLDNVDVSPQERQAAHQLSEDEVSAMVRPVERQRAPVAPQEVVDHVRAKYQPEAAPPPRSAQPPPQPPPVTHNRAAAPPPRNARSSSSQKNIMTAVLSLLNELNEESLDILHQEISERLGLSS
eukprot:EG_transcript_20962